MTVNSRDKRRRALGAAAVLATALLAACGGGEQTTRFRAARVVVFGDESSLIVDTRGDANGSKFTVNATVSATDQTLVCSANPNWVQSVAALYSLVYPQCNPGPNPVVAPTSRMRATLGARAADLGAQIDAQQAESPLGAGDLVTVLVGEYDVLAEYQSYPVQSEAQLIANVEAEGAEVGRQVNRLADLGAKVILSTIVDVGVTPFAVAQRTANTDIDRAALLTRMSQRFNASLRATIVNDGRKIGLVLLDELVTTVGKFPGLLGFTNSSQGVCDLTKSTLTPPSTLDCTTQTLIANGSGAYLWADSLHLGASAQNQLGTAAITRAQNNPF